MQLQRDIRRFLEVGNYDPKSFTRTKPADDILKSVQRFCERTAMPHDLTQN